VRKGKEYLPIELKYKTKHPAKTENASAKAPAKSSGCAGGVRGMSGCAGVPACSLKEVRSPGRTTEKPSSFEEEEASSGTNTANNAIREDAIEAMARLGYKDAGTRKKIDDYLSANPNTTLEDVIKNILQQI
ncbi:MAG: RuvA C-terminal domain-containing protein, partial [Paludibacteraceae bacterium]